MSVNIYPGTKQPYFHMNHLYNYPMKGFDKMFPYKTPEEFYHAIMMNTPLKSPCPTATAINLLSGKWELKIIYQLFIHDTLRFGQLKKHLPGITNTMLTKILQKFITASIVSRVQYNEIPPHVEYSLTKQGRQLNTTFFELAKWADQLYRTTDASPFTISQVAANKKQYLSLLLLADEQESMIDRYLDKGTMYVLDDDGVKAECVVIDEGNGILEIKNIATAPEYQGKGYARKLIEYIAAKYKDTYNILQVGTGDSPLTIPFYEKCGFVRHHIIKNFFTDNYDHPIFECGIQLVDMVYLQRKL